MSIVALDSSQIRALDRKAIDAFVGRCIPHMRKTFPDSLGDAPEAALRADLAGAVKRADALKIEREIDVVRWLEMRERLGHGFETEPRFAWVMEILKTNAPAQERLDSIVERFAFDPLCAG